MEETSKANPEVDNPSRICFNIILNVYSYVDVV